MMKIDKPLLVELFRVKDRRRRRLLFDAYKPYFDARLTHKFIASTLSLELGAEGIVTVADVQYCQFYFNPKKSARGSSSFSLKQQESTVVVHTTSADDIKWTDPDDETTDNSRL